MLDFETFKAPLGAWAEKIKPFIESEKGEELYRILKQRSSEGHKILPTSDRTYRAFKLCPPENVKCIIMGMSPYPNVKEGIPFADGLAFSNGLVKEESPSLKLFYNAMKLELGRDIERSLDLSYLADQGVLLLNASLTTELGKPSVHNDMKLWDPFYKFLFTEVLDTLCGVPIILCGAEAKKIGASFLFKMCHVVKEIEHPAFAARQHRAWNNEKCFTWANEIIKQNLGELNTIQWDKETLPWE